MNDDKGSMGKGNNVVNYFKRKIVSLCYVGNNKSTCSMIKDTCLGFVIVHKA